MDSDLKLALTMLEVVLASGDEKEIQQQVLEMRASGIFSPEMYQHLNELEDPKLQLRAIIDSIKVEEAAKDRFTTEQKEAIEALSKLSYEEQFQALEDYINYRQASETANSHPVSTKSEPLNNAYVDIHTNQPQSNAPRYPEPYSLPTRLFILFSVVAAAIYFFIL